MTPIYVLLRLLLAALTPCLRLMASRGEKKFERLTAEAKGLAEAVRDRTWGKVPAEETIRLNSRDSVKIAGVQAAADSAERSFESWQARAECAAGWANWLAKGPGPIKAMLMGQADVILAVFLFAVGGGLDPLSLSIDTFSWMSATCGACCGWASENPGVLSAVAGLASATGLTGGAAAWAVKAVRRVRS